MSEDLRIKTTGEEVKTKREAQDALEEATEPEERSFQVTNEIGPPLYSHDVPVTLDGQLKMVDMMSHHGDFHGDLHKGRDDSEEQILKPINMMPKSVGDNPRNVWNEGDDILTSHNIEDIFPELGDQDYNENWEKAKISKRQDLRMPRTPTSKTETGTKETSNEAKKPVHEKIIFDKSVNTSKKMSVFDRIGQAKDSHNRQLVVTDKSDDSCFKKSVFDRMGKAQINEISSSEDGKRSVFDRIGKNHQNEISSSLDLDISDGLKRRSVDYVTQLKASLKTELNQTRGRAWDIKRKYYEKAVAIWSRFNNIKIPDMEDLPEVRVYKNRGVIVSFDMPDEYIDNYHPLWQTEKNLVDGVMKEMYTPAQIPRFIHSKWGWRNEIDIRRNLSQFSKITQAPISFKSGEERNEPMGSQGRMRVREIGDLNKGINVLQNMMTALKGCDSSQEVAGIDIWNKIQKGALQQPVQESSMSKQATTANETSEMVSLKNTDVMEKAQKRKCDDNDEQNDHGSKKKRKVSLDNFEDEAVDFTREKYKWDKRPWMQKQLVNESAGIIASARESFHFNSFYVAGDKADLTEEETKEMFSLETSYQAIMSHYASPYASGKHNLGR